MDDISLWVEFLKQFGINAKVKTESDGRKTIIMKVENDSNLDGITISDKISGYVGLYIDVTFNSKGEFQSIGMWEEL